MPPTTPVLTRRAGLALLVALPAGLLAACAGDDAATGTAQPAPNGSSAPTVADPAAEEADLVALYDAVLAAFPGSVANDLLTALRDQHAQHRDALGGAGSPATTSPAVPATLDAALASLATTERQAARSRTRACVAATDDGQARLLSLIAASEAAHVPALRDARGGAA